MKDPEDLGKTGVCYTIGEQYALLQYDLRGAKFRRGLVDRLN